MLEDSTYIKFLKMCRDSTSIVGTGRVRMGKREMQGLPRGTRKLFGAMDQYSTLVVMMTSWMCKYVKTYPIVHFKYVQLIICQLSSIEL